MTHLFQTGTFRLHSGAVSDLKVECDAFTWEDWHTLARQVAARISFATVEGVPRGGLKFATCLAQYVSGSSANPVLICDDVLSTGASMEQQRAGREAIGVVVFARGPLPPWVRAVWQWGL